MSFTMNVCIMHCTPRADLTGTQMLYSSIHLIALVFPGPGPIPTKAGAIFMNAEDADTDSVKTSKDMKKGIDAENAEASSAMQGS